MPTKKMVSQQRRERRHLLFREGNIIWINRCCYPDCKNKEAILTWGIKEKIPVCRDHYYLLEAVRPAELTI